MNIGEKITLYKERLAHKNFQDFGRAANCSGDWLNDISKIEEIKVVSINNLINLCDYLGITINQLVVNDENDIKVIEGNVNIDENSDDIGTLISQMETLVDNKEGIKFDGIVMNDKAKEICKDSLDVIRTLTKQHL